MCFGMAIPGADILTDITAKNPRRNGSLVRFGQCAVQLNGHVRDAAGTVHHFRRNNGSRVTGIQTTGARATVIGHGRIRGEIVVNDEFSEEEKAALVFAQKEAILANPAQTASLGPGALHDRSRVHKATPLDFAKRFTEAVEELEEFVLHNEVVVFTVGIFGNARFFSVCEVLSGEIIVG